MRRAGIRDIQGIRRFVAGLNHSLSNAVSVPGDPGAAAFLATVGNRTVGYACLSSIRAKGSRVNHVGVVEIFASSSFFLVASNLLYDKLLLLARERELTKLHSQETASHVEALGFLLGRKFNIEGLLKNVVRIRKNKRDDIVLLGALI